MNGLAVLRKGTTTPDAVLVQEAAAGSGVSYGSLYDRYATQVFNYCLRVTGSEEDAADATQEAFVNVLRRLQDDDRPVLEFSAYLFAAARNESYALMSQRARTLPSDSPPPERGRVADLETDPERSVLLSDSQQAVRDANAQLPPRHREVLALREVAGRSYEEIGATMGISENAAAQLIWRARLKLREAMTAGAVASVVATSEECERAQMLLSRVQDGEPVEEADRIWLKQHLDECDSCKTANRLLLEVGASYRLWLPLGLLAGMRADTLTRAGQLVGADWSHVPTPGKGSAATSAGGGVSGAAAGAVATVAAAAIAAAGIGAFALLGNDEASGPVDPVAKKPAASARQAAAEKTPPRKRDAKPARAGGKFVAARASGTFAATPAVAAAPLGLPAPLSDTGAPESGNEPPESNPPRDRTGPSEDNPGQPPGDTPGSDVPTPPEQTPPGPPLVPEPTVETPPPTQADPTRPVDPTLPPVDPTDPAIPPSEDPVCNFPGRGEGPDLCPPGQGGDPPGDVKDPGDIRNPGDIVTPPGSRVP